MRFPNDHFLGGVRNGVNHVAMNLNLNGWVGWSAATPVGPERGMHYPTYPDTLFNWYQSRKVRSARVLFTWEALQAVLGGPVPPGGTFDDYWSDLKSVVQRFLARGIYVVLGPWQHNTTTGDTGVKYKNASFTAANFNDLWGKFAVAVNAFTGNDPRVAFDLINEPHTPDVTLDEWFGIAQAAIDGIRAAGAQNTILVPGMNYTASTHFVSNGSAAKWLALVDPLNNLGVTVHCYIHDAGAPFAVSGLRDAFSALVPWARFNGAKIHIGEIALDAGPNGAAPFQSDWATADAQWADWAAFCIDNSDVLVGWNWWANSAPGWWSAQDSAQGHHWGLTLDAGVTQTVYMNLIQDSVPQPRLTIRDDNLDLGNEPNPTTVPAWETPDVWVRQTDDGAGVGDTVLGGAPCFVYVAVSNRGDAEYPDTGNDVVKTYWAKARAGLNWPAPWEGLGGGSPLQGGPVHIPVLVGRILAGQTKRIAIPWIAPNPVDYGGDGHFCLLAIVGKPAKPTFGDFAAGVDLNANVLAAANVAWRNIHLVPNAMLRRLGDLVVSNYSAEHRRVRVRFAATDAQARPFVVGPGLLTATPVAFPDGAEARRHNGGCERQLGDPLNVDERGFELELKPAEAWYYELTLRDQQAHDLAIRVTQYFVDDTGIEHAVGGQTFVMGSVEGYSKERDSFQDVAAIRVFQKGQRSQNAKHPSE